MWGIKWINSTTGTIWDNYRHFHHVAIYILSNSILCYSWQHFLSESEEQAAYWVGFGEHCGDAMTHILLDKQTQKIIYRSAVSPITKVSPNHRLDTDRVESGTPT